MRLFHFFAAAVLLIAASVFSAQAQDSHIRVTEAYALPTAATQKNGVALMVIENHGDEPNRVIGVHSDIAEKVEMHTHIMKGDVMQMREIEGYDLPPHTKTSLEATGHHIMLIGLKKRLESGVSFPLTLELEHGAPITLVVPVDKK